MISVNNLHKAYGRKTVLGDVSVQFPARRMTSLIGPNGAGKSTLLMLMARLLEPTCGEILIGGQPVAQLPVSAYAKQVATLRQAPDFNLRLKVEELVAFGRFPYSRGRLTREDQRLIDEAISFLSLDRLRGAYIDELSGGQRQMVFLAMTIAQQTDCLLLDEPLNNLDMKHAVQIMRALRRLCDEQGRTVILVVHDINFAASYSDHIVAMKDGAVRFSGAVEEVVTRARLEELYELDFEMLRSERGLLCNYFNPSDQEREHARG
ncbi:iron ABC transporter ATP-binding protein [Pseudomonas sp. Fl4BN1]|uniref:iron ABC transporter ATP-binding protein n=1 Tax=Pseudomonas sp. Fl4BN1 TaxID=2697651 RepID=UPI0013777E94|nr:ATP-binding cassette domain-containing protein [Pseudomonas sp. Fl4BN1]NBF12684.1 ATP-binding cassette domain-containing protein [Pseudomonas sp. Fl4BN1]